MLLLLVDKNLIGGIIFNEIVSKAKQWGTNQRTRDAKRLNRNYLVFKYVLNSNDTFFSNQQNRYQPNLCI